MFLSWRKHHPFPDALTSKSLIANLTPYWKRSDKHIQKYSVIVFYAITLY